MAGGGIGALPMQVATDNKLYCVGQSPHNDVSEMIGCDQEFIRKDRRKELLYYVNLIRGC